MLVLKDVDVLGATSEEQLSDTDKRRHEHDCGAKYIVLPTKVEKDGPTRCTRGMTPTIRAKDCSYCIGWRKALFIGASGSREAAQQSPKRSV